MNVLGTWVESSFVVRSRPFVVSTMGSVTTRHYNVSSYNENQPLHVVDHVVTVCISCYIQLLCKRTCTGPTHFQTNR